MNLDAFQSLWLKVRPFALPAWLCFFALLCLTGLNPYFRPDYHDNITYYVAAESLLAGNGYTFQGAPIADWPPVTSLILAAVFAIFGSSIYAAKLVSITAAILSVLLANRLLRREDRPDRLKTIAIFTLTPIALLTATTVASDWICAAFSFGCLLTLWHLREKRTIHLAIAAGVLLGLAALTRQTGVLLGAAIVFQAFSLFRKHGIRTIIPEFIAAAIGASMFITWGLYTATQVAKHPALTGNYASKGLTLFTDFSFSELANSIFDLFFKWDDVLEKLGFSSALSNALLIIPTAILITGVISILRHTKIHPSDVYALAFLALIFGYHWKLGRYLLPIAPFMIAWFFAGLRSIGKFLRRGRPTRDRLIPTIAALWVAFLIPLDAYLLFNKTGNGAHRGISTFTSPTPADYYVGLWADLYAACEMIKQDPIPGAVAGTGDLRYIQAFTGRLAAEAKTPKSNEERTLSKVAAFTIFIADETETDPSIYARPGDTIIFETKNVTVFRRQ